MRALLLTVTLALPALAACSVMDDELDEITFKGAGGTDADGIPCTVNILGYLEMDGVCQEPSDDCEGGTNPMNSSGDCDEGVCCIGTDQCEKFTSVLECSSSACADEGGGPFGCPDNGWCCPIL